MKKILALFSLLAVLCLIASLSLMYSPYGGKAVSWAVHKYAGKDLAIGRIVGSPLTSLQLEDVSIQTDDIDISLSSLSLKWDCSALLRGQVRVNTAYAQDLDLTFKGGEETIESVPTGEFVLELPEKLLPFFNLQIDDLLVEGISFFDPAGELVEKIDSLRISGKVVGDSITLSELTVEDIDYALSFHGSAIVGQVWQADLQCDWRFSNWDGGELLGTLSAEGPLPDMDIQLVLLAPAKVDIRGKMRNLPGNPHFEVTGKGDWTRLPLIHPSCPEIRLNAVVEASGTIDEYRGWLKTTGEYWKFKNITGETYLRGSIWDLHFNSLIFTHEGSVVDVTGGYLDWRTDFVVGGVLDVHGFNPGVMDELWYGNLDGIIDGLLTVDEDDNDVWGNYQIRNLAGTWRDFPVAGGADLHFTHDAFVVDHADVMSGNSKLSYHGAFTDSMDMKFLLNSPRLEELIPGSRGSLDLTLALNGSYEDPLISSSVTGQQLQYSGISLASVEGKIGPSGQKQEQLKAHLVGTHLDINGFQLGDLSLVAGGDMQGHRGKLLIGATDKRVEVAFKGGYLKEQYKAAIDLFEVIIPKGDRWRLQGTSEINLGKSDFSLSKSCFVNQKGEACFTGKYTTVDDSSMYSVDTSLENISLHQLYKNGIISQPLSGVFSAAIKIEGDSEALTVLQGEARTESGTVLIEFEENEQIAVFDETVLDFDFNGQKLKGTLATTINDSRCTLDLTSDWNGDFTPDFSEMAMEGSLLISDFDVDFFDFIGGYTVQPSGMLNANLHVYGTMGAPLLRGGLTLVDGQVELPDLGIFLRGLQVNIEGHEGEIEVNGLALSGNGKAEIKGTLFHDEKWKVSGDIDVIGEDFLLLDLPEYEVFVNPDIRLKFNENKAQLTGKVVIPKAYIAPEEMSDALSQSEDVVFLDGTNGTEEGVFRLSSHVQLDLGDEVTFKGYGLKGRLVGSLAVVDEPGNPLEGTGALSFVDSSFSTHGRTLDIDRGKIIFTGGSLLNPGLDVRAQKVVSDQVGSRGGYTVGVDISGFLSDLNYTLFSKPYMTDGDILAYLLLGHSLFDSTSEEGNILTGAADAFGWEDRLSLLSTITSVLPVDDIHIEGSSREDDMSLVVGRSLTEDIYVGYDYNVLDQLGEVRLRYDLKYGFFVESRSSSESTGADLLYIIER